MKKNFYIVLALIFVLTLSACNGADTSKDVTRAPSDTPVISAPSSDNLPERNASQTANPVNCVFDSAQFHGKIQSCTYAGNGILFVVADKLYLYDTTTATVLAVTETPLPDFNVQAIDGGYILSGMGDDGAMAYIYDGSLVLNKELIINELLPEDFVISETGIEASTDGKKLAIAGMRGLYLYDLQSGDITTLLDLGQNAGTSTIQVSLLNDLAFIQDNSQLVFYGQGVSIPVADGEEGFSIYGSMVVDGSNLKLTKPSAYDIEEMQNRDGRLFFPQTFTRNNGSLLWIDGKTGGENMLTYSTVSEGGDGVYSSECGKYVATSVLDGNLTIRVYEVDSGKLIGIEVIENADNTYFKRIPRIYLMEGAKTAVVLLGGSISEVDTLVSTFTFGE